MKRVAVVDERGELAAMKGCRALNDLGSCCDVLDGWSKPEGILHAVRCLSPQVIICDELGGDDDAQAAILGASGGAHIIATAHCSDKKSLECRKFFKLIRESGAFSRLAVLESEPGAGFEVFDL